MYKHILIPTDGTPLAEKAVASGVRFAREAGARVTLFTAVPEYQPPSESQVMARQVVSLEEYARRSHDTADGVLAAGAELARAAGVEFDTDYAESDRPAHAIVEAARRHGCDAVFMASHGRSGLSRLVHGSETYEVINESEIPTMVYR
ncbi:MAG: putative universal stress protein [Burkholderiales bacterium]|jgi:nucleotide-binding universal stress UspA family protein|nr:putative universal stress protein [Burkholderiales bacterium]